MNDQKISIYEEITVKIVTALEDGVNPWAKPWQTVHYGPFRNALTNRPTDEGPWRYGLAPDATFILTALEGGDMKTPWAKPPIGLRGALRDAGGKPVEVTLKPLGSALLRRTSFPMMGSSGSPAE